MEDDDLKWMAARGCATGLMATMLAVIIFICLLAG